MICKNCLIAGRLMTDLREAPDDRQASRVEEQIEYWHSRCLDPIKCPCRHKIPEVTNG